MTSGRIAKLRALAEKATAGPWTHHEGDECQYLMAARTSQTLAWVEDRSQDSHPTQYRDDAEFIAAARTALPEALTEIERLRAHLLALDGMRDGTHAAALDKAEGAIERVRALPRYAVYTGHLTAGPDWVKWSDVLAALEGKSNG